MMQSIALTESNMVQDDEYVIVQAEDMDLDDTWDDCDEELDVRLSPLPSVCSEGNSSKGYVPNDLEALIEDSVTASIVSLEDVEGGKERIDSGEAPMETDEDEDSDKRGESDPTSSAPETINDSKGDSTTESKPVLKSDVADTGDQPKLLAPGGGSRLSNKKRRKKVKMIKKAAAAAAAAAALAEMNKASIAPTSPPTSPVRNVHQPHQKSRKACSSTRGKKQHSHANNLAVACAQESLESFRNDHNMKVKKTAPNYVSLL